VLRGCGGGRLQSDDTVRDLLTSPFRIEDNDAPARTSPPGSGSYVESGRLGRFVFKRPKPLRLAIIWLRFFLNHDGQAASASHEHYPKAQNSPVRTFALPVISHNVNLTSTASDRKGLPVPGEEYHKVLVCVP